jgi:hypothetical protein
VDTDVCAEPELLGLSVVPSFSAVVWRFSVDTDLCARVLGLAVAPSSLVVVWGLSVSTNICAELD